MHTMPTETERAGARNSVAARCAEGMVPRFYEQTPALACSSASSLVISLVHTLIVYSLSVSQCSDVKRGRFRAFTLFGECVDIAPLESGLFLKCTAG
ncbi:hypothetical protein ElyMa_001856100 [Elysia marginata]|uniref:Uncharacterized protein n=1 Tax=Elysia marginata TaxID=1093978 RepID=A0AAV4ELX5_9GAST|nr:hypothetical protein ElyMa_001856100 [Elysia marginata]